MANPPPDCRHQAPLSQSNSIGELFLKFGEAYIRQYKPYIDQIKLIRNIRKCRTPAMGALVVVCKSCGEMRWFYKSCGDAKCPVCQSIKRLQSSDKISAKMLAVPYVHTTFTLPHELNPLLKLNKKLLYSLLYKSSWQAVKSLCAEPKNVGGLPGMIALMHTWGSDMKYHVHLHTLITFGGLDASGDWQYPERKDKLFRYRAINKAFKKYYLDGLVKLYEKGALKKVEFTDEIIAKVSEKKWVVNNGLPQVDTTIIEEYLSRYIMKIAVSNSRLSLDAAKTQVQLIYNDYSRQQKGQPAPKQIRIFTNPLSFIHQFLMHLPPKYFQRIRYYGLHAPATFKRIKDEIPKKLKRVGKTVRTVLQIINSLLKDALVACQSCEGLEFDQQLQAPDYNWLAENVPGYQKRAPPDRPSSYYLKKKANERFVNGQTMSAKHQKVV